MPATETVWAGHGWPAVTGTGDAALPQPLRIAAVEPDDLVGRPIYVIGYPAWDGRRNEPEPMRRIFMDVDTVERLQPGVTVESQTPETVLRHDCSTLGGNSGSPVSGLASHTVVGLHFGAATASATTQYRCGVWSTIRWSHPRA